MEDRLWGEGDEVGRRGAVAITQVLEHTGAEPRAMVAGGERSDGDQIMGMFGECSGVMIAALPARLCASMDFPTFFPSQSLWWFCKEAGIIPIS